MRLAVFIFWGVFLLGQDAPAPQGPKAEPPTGSVDQKSQTHEVGPRSWSQECGLVDILSDTQGINFGPYLQLAISQVKQNWHSLIPDSEKLKQGKVTIEFAITRDGKVADIRSIASSGDDALDRAAWGSIVASSPFRALPQDFLGPYLALRFRFCYNPDTKSKSTVAVIITAPGDLRVPIGGSEVVTATVTGTKENAVEWSVSGSGCSGAGCGKVTGDLYIAPSVLPDPALVTLTAVSKADPTARASVTVHLIQTARPR